MYDWFIESVINLGVTAVVGGVALAILVIIISRMMNG